MFALTLYEPWAWAFTAADKRIENRESRPEDWGLKLRQGDHVALHAGKKYDLDGAIDLGMMLAEDGLVVPDEEELVMGAVAAVARFYAVFKTIPEASTQLRWRAETRYAWFFDKVWCLPTRVPARGHRRLWRLPEDVHEEVDHQWGKCESPCR